MLTAMTGADGNEMSKAVSGRERIGQMCAVIMRQAKTKEEGFALVQKLQSAGGSYLFGDLNLPADSSPQELEEAYNRCVPFYNRNREHDIQYLVTNVQEKSSSLMDADNRFRHLKSKVGSKLQKGILTQDILHAAQVKVHEYWSRVTPGNVAQIVDKMVGKCPDWPSASKKFDWIWGQLNWRQGGGCVTVGGREYTSEDLEQAERKVREKFGLKPSGGEKRLMGSGPDRPAKPKPDEPTVPADATAKPTHVQTQVPAPEKSASTDATADTAATLPKEPQAAEHKPAHPNLTNAEFIAESILKKCDSMESAQKFFDWLRKMERKSSAMFKGRSFTLQDITDAEKKCSDAWRSSRKRSQENEDEAEDKEGSASSSSSSSSSESDAKEAEEQKREASVQDLVDYVLKKTSKKKKVEKYFGNLFNKPGKKIRDLGRVYSQSELTEAWLQCQAALQEKHEPARKKAKNEKASLRAGRGSKKELSNPDFIVQEALRKCGNQNKASVFFSSLHNTVGELSPLGRIFTLEEITEAELRVYEWFDKQKQVAGSDDEGSNSSSSSSERLPRGRARKAKSDDALVKGKQSKKGRKAKAAGEELEGALFGSDSEELSGEESVDEEEEGVGADFLADLADADEEQQVLEDGYEAEFWEELTPEVLPGFEGFNRRATAVMIKARIGQGKLQVTFDKDAACPPLQPHQEAVGFLMHPKSPVSRILVDHPTGSGKTREMIKVLDNYFYDPRPKIPIFPKDPVCRNFYFELLRWPSRYRDYYCCVRPADAAIASGKPEWKEVRHHFWDLSGFPEDEVRRLCFTMREVLEMKGMFYMGRVRKSVRSAFHKKHPGESMPAAPLRALGYTSAGGSFAGINLMGMPVSSIMKVGFANGSGNVYTNKIVLMDEAHNLVRSQTQYAEQLQRLRRLLYEARNLVLAGFTGTPILSEPSEGRQLLDIIKGLQAPEGDEGFLSSFPMRPQPLFPMSLPRGLPDGVLTLARRKQLIRKVELHGEALKMYDVKRRLGLPGRRLRAYCNVSIFHAAFHDGRAGSKGKILAYPEDCCPKLLAVANAVASSPEKAIVMIARTSGYTVMLELMRKIAAQTTPSFSVATMNELSEFNHSSNLRGEVFRVLVADSLQCSEGVSFLAVRRTFLADVPVTPSTFIQQCGRAIRMYGHRGLPDNEQTVTTQLYVSQLPKWMRSSTLACWALRAQKKGMTGKEVEKRTRVLTARMNRAGINSLEELKARIDAHGEAKKQSLGAIREGKEGLTADDVLTFLEQNGLWEEAKLLRNAEKQQEKKERDKAAQEKAKADQSQESFSMLRSDVPGTLKTQNTLETIKTQESSEALGRGESIEEDEFAAALGAMLDEEIGGQKADKASKPKDDEDDEDMEEEDRQQEMDELRKEDEELAREQEIDGDLTARSISASAVSTKQAEQGVLTSSIAKPPMSQADIAERLSEILGVLRNACREAEKKPTESVAQPSEEFDKTSLQTAVPTSDDAEKATRENQLETASGFQVEAGVAYPDNASTAAVETAHVDDLLVTAEDPTAPAGKGGTSAEQVAIDTVEASAAEEPGMVAEQAPADVNKLESPAEGVGGAEVPDIVFPMLDPVESGEPWRAALRAGLESAKDLPAYRAAVRSALPTFDPMIGDLNSLSIQQIRQLRDEVLKQEKTETLRLAVSMIKEVRGMIAEAEASAQKLAENQPVVPPQDQPSELAVQPEVAAAPSATIEHSLTQPAENRDFSGSPAKMSLDVPMTEGPTAGIMSAAPDQERPAESGQGDSKSQAQAEAAAPQSTAIAASCVEQIPHDTDAREGEHAVAEEALAMATPDDASAVEKTNHLQIPEARDAEAAVVEECGSASSQGERAETGEYTGAEQSYAQVHEEADGEADDAEENHTDASDRANPTCAGDADATVDEECSSSESEGERGDKGEDAGGERSDAHVQGEVNEEAADAEEKQESASDQMERETKEKCAGQQGDDQVLGDADAEAAAVPEGQPDDAEVQVDTDAVAKLAEGKTDDAQTQAQTEAKAKTSALELAWRRKLATALKNLKRSEHVKSALEVAAPGVMEKAVEAEQKALLKEKGVEQDQDDEEQADLLSLGIGPEHVKRLHDELVRLLELAEKGAAKPRALVRAMQMLYLAESVADAVGSLRSETADEEALQELTARSEEFAPALGMMRSLAVDRDVFSHLAEDLDEENPEVAESESEASDVEKDLAGKKNEMAPVVLPPGWRLEWVKRKKNEMREFVDPNGVRYRNVREVRAALLEWEAREAALAAAAKAAEALANAPPPKRIRLRKKCHNSAFDPPCMDAATTAPVRAALEEAFAQDLLAELGVNEGSPAASSSSPAVSSKAFPAHRPAQAEKGLVVGAEVRLGGLMDQLGLNGQRGRLGDYDADTDRWECFLVEGGGKVNIQAGNLEILSLPRLNVAKRMQPQPANTRAVRAKGRGKGRSGRGDRGGAPVSFATAAPAAPDADEESD
eukprot:TRINITY_DN88400_c0_g1_i1.p1 TRINITY_DN88400_c0_g1~~TRINITY_DN88400_c0_g1_i1.p1  ORF type:complete len:2469 (+),score=622.90 TRINITY_DN88400_c0_g1_i1:85-7491(+)